MYLTPSDARVGGFSISSRLEKLLLNRLLGKGRRVSELCSRKAECSCFAAAVAHIFARVLPCGMPFEAIPLSPSHAVGERKRKSCGATSERKSADSRVFGEKGRCVARPQNKRCRLADFRRKRKRCGVTSLPFSTTRRKRKVGGATSARKSADSRIFGEKRNCVARPQNLPNILHFFVNQHRLNDP